MRARTGVLILFIVAAWLCRRCDAVDCTTSCSSSDKVIDNYCCFAQATKVDVDVCVSESLEGAGIALAALGLIGVLICCPCMVVYVCLMLLCFPISIVVAIACFPCTLFIILIVVGLVLVLQHRQTASGKINCPMASNVTYVP
jgi:hypothetical protein